jgi:hypothetical protein
LVLRIITALVVILHCPIPIIDALLIAVLIAAPAHLLAIRTLTDADHALRRRGWREDVVNPWATAHKNDADQKQGRAPEVE